MKKYSWIETQCKNCPFLFAAGNDLFQCGKLKVLPVEFQSVETKKPQIKFLSIVNGICPGVKDLPRLEANFITMYEVKEKLD